MNGTIQVRSEQQTDVFMSKCGSDRDYKSGEQHAGSGGSVPSALPACGSSEFTSLEQLTLPLHVPTFVPCFCPFHNKMPNVL